jgi:hypothetical protein
MGIRKVSLLAAVAAAAMVAAYAASAKDAKIIGLRSPAAASRASSSRARRISPSARSQAATSRKWSSPRASCVSLKSSSSTSRHGDRRRGARSDLRDRGRACARGHGGHRRQFRPRRSAWAVASGDGAEPQRESWRARPRGCRSDRSHGARDDLSVVNQGEPCCENVQSQGRSRVRHRRWQRDRSGHRDWPCGSGSTRGAVRPRR